MSTPTWEQLQDKVIDRMKTKNQKGILTIDFIFSFGMVMGLFQVFYVLTYTLMVAHLTQYITFASGRLYNAGHIDENSQRALAERKFEELTLDSAVANFFRGPFAVSNFEAREFTEYDTPAPYRQKYIGVKVRFQSNVLDFSVPFLGRTNTELEGNAFQANMASYLYREPTADECFRFMEERAEAILNLDGKYGSLNVTPDQVGVFADNGC